MGKFFHEEQGLMIRKKYPSLPIAKRCLGFQTYFAILLAGGLRYACNNWELAFFCELIIVL